jgi:hypothetical protein
VIFLDPKKKYECPECHNLVKPKLEVIGGETDNGVFNKVFKDQCCPRCHRSLPDDLKPVSETLPVSNVANSLPDDLDAQPEKFLANSLQETDEAGLTAPPKCFVSYSWDSPKHEAWVLNLATRLVGGGVAIVLDKWNLQFGDDLPHFMETAVRESDFVILVCTPRYAQKANAGSGGTGYEKRIVTGEMFHSQKPSKFVPLVREGSNQSALPTFLRSSYYIDFRKGAEFEQSLMDLLHQLHGVPKFPRPELGKSPFSGTGQNVGPRIQTILNLPPPLDMALKMPTSSDKPKVEDLQLRGATLIGSFGRLHVENVGLRWVTINRYSVDLAEPKVLAPPVLIDAGLSGALTIAPNSGTKFERGRSYEIRAWSGAGTEFQFTVGF